MKWTRECPTVEIKLRLMEQRKHWATLTKAAIFHGDENAVTEQDKAGTADTAKVGAGPNDAGVLHGHSSTMLAKLAAALLCVHGRIAVITTAARINIHALMGAVVGRDKPYSLTSDSGAILLIVEAQELTTHARAISTPQRIAGQQWPSDKVGST